MKIKDAIQERFDLLQERIAQAIYDGDWSTLIWNIALVLAVLLAAVALGVGILALVWKALGTLLGKIFAVPILLLIIGLSWKMNLEDWWKKKRKEGKPVTLDEWAEDVYDYVRDAMFLYYFLIKNSNNPITAGDATNQGSGKPTDGFTKSINNLFQSSKYLIPKAHLAKLFPNLLNRIHLRGIWRNIK